MKKREWVQDCPPYNYDFDMKSSKSVVEDPLFDYSIIEMPSGSVSVSNDISILFNLQRLENKITPEQLREYFSKYTPNSSPYANENLSDDMLLDSVKSRHIQSLSELRSWAKYVSEELDEFISDNVKKDLSDETENKDSNSVDSSSGSSEGA